jgi:hypothetical protein
MAEPSDHFSAMAERIKRNDPKEFAGGYVILSPSGTVVSQMFVNPVGDEAAFWGFIAAAVQTAGAEAVQKLETAQGFNRGMVRR